MLDNNVTDIDHLVSVDNATLADNTTLINSSALDNNTITANNVTSNSNATIGSNSSLTDIFGSGSNSLGTIQISGRLIPSWYEWYDMSQSLPEAGIGLIPNISPMVKTSSRMIPPLDHYGDTGA